MKYSTVLKLKKDTTKVMTILLIFGLVGIMIYSASGMWIAKHNIDLSYNYEKFSNDVNEILHNLGSNNSVQIIPYPSQVGDMGNNYQIFPLRDYYIAGMNQLDTYFYMFGASALVFGFLIAKVLEGEK